MIANHLRAALLLSSVVVMVTVTVHSSQLSFVEASNNTKSSQNKTKLQARVLLESNNLDLDEKQPSDVYLNNLTANSTTRSIRRQKVKKSRADNGGGLRNIWSMFLPGSSSGSEASDYEDSADESADDASDPVSSSSNMTSSSDLVANLDNDNPITDGEGLVLKNPKPYRQGGTSSDSLMSSSSSQLVSGTPDGTRPSFKANSTSMSESSDFITGAVSKPDEGVNMNDIVSNLMGSMGNRTRTSGEREEVDVRTVSPPASLSPIQSTNKTSMGEENFERWLNKIRSQDPAMQTTGQSPTERPYNINSPSGIHLMSSRRQAIRNNVTQHDGVDPSDVREVNFGQHSLKAHNSPTKSGQEQQPAGKRRIIQRQQQPDMNSRFQHPFQQNLRQQQWQLIHGIRYPSVQASTISVSTRDGASNTSLSLGGNIVSPDSMSHLVPVVGVGQTVNPINHQNGSDSNSDNSQEQQSVYQSQDEILRQVTSAINFEQQLNHKKREQDQQNEPNAENWPKLIKANSSLNEAIGSKPSSALSGVEDIDKSFDMLAEKLRLLALQQQQQQNQFANSSRPTWLRRPNLQESSLLAAANSENGTKSLDRLLELIGQHEKNKHELKTSQDSMAQLVQHLSKLDGARNKQPAADKQNEVPINSVSGEALNVDPTRENLAGPWTPLSVLGPSAATNDARMPPSPASMAKQKYQQQLKQHTEVISQLNDNIGEGNDFAGDDYYLNNLSMMFVSSPNGGASSPYGLDKAYGLPIAVLKDEEERPTIKLPPGQLEAAAIAAAEQLVGHNQRSAHRLVSNGPLNEAALTMVPPHLVRPHLNPASEPRQQQQPQHSEPINQIQKLLQQYSPQTFTHGSAHRAPLPMNLPEQPRVRPMMSHSQSEMEQHRLVPNDVASLIHDQAPISFEHEMYSKNLVDTPNHLITASNIDARPNYHRQQPLNERPNIEQDSVLMKQHTSDLVGSTNRVSQDLQRLQQQHSVHNNLNTVQQQPQQLVAPINLQLQRQQEQQRQLQQQQMFGYVEYHPVHPTLVGDFNPSLYAGNSQAPMITTVSHPGLPIRIREVNLPRPFGFRSHHSVAYTASPAISALRAGLAQSANRPSLLRQMSPLRATLGHGQRLLAPLIQPQVPAGHLHYSPHQASSVHFSPVVAPFMNDPRQFRRQSSGSTASQRPSDDWKKNSYSAASKLKVSHLEPMGEDIDRPDRQNLMIDDGTFEEFLFDPSLRESHLEHEFKVRKPIRKPVDLHTKQQFARKRQVVSNAPSQAKLRQLRGRHYDLPQIQIDKPSLPKIKPTCEPQPSSSMKPNNVAPSTPLPLATNTTGTLNMDTSVNLSSSATYGNDVVTTASPSSTMASQLSQRSNLTLASIVGDMI